MSPNLIIKRANKMPQYRRINEFLQRVHQANTRYERVKRSSLRPLLAILNNHTGTSQQVRQAIATLAATADANYRNKANKYKEALYFLQRTYPIAPGQRISVNPQASRAVLYNRTAMPPNFNAYGHGMYHNTARVVSLNNMMNKTVEEYLYTVPGHKGIVLIHLGSFQAPMSTRIDGWPVLSHMKSVLRVARDVNCNICVLHMGGNPEVCPELANEVNAFGNRVVVHEVGNHHMGNHHQAFRNFVRRHSSVVVMGFDADICVRANLFGTTEYFPDHRTVPPIISMTNVITSRALLVTTGTINPVGHQGEYGQLYGT